jgi:hypothetical protein
MLPDSPRVVSALRKVRGVNRDRLTAKDQTTGHRACSRCREVLPLTEFRRDSRGYWRSHCRTCMKAANQEWRARHHDERLVRRREQHARAKAPPGSDPRHG